VEIMNIKRIKKKMETYVKIVLGIIAALFIGGILLNQWINRDLARAMREKAGFCWRKFGRRK